MSRPFWEKAYTALDTPTFGEPSKEVRIVVFTDAIPPPEDMKAFCVGLFREGEIFTYYSDWEPLLERSYVF